MASRPRKPATGWQSGEVAAVDDSLSQLLPSRPPASPILPSIRFRRILVCADGTHASQLAIDWARALALVEGARVRVFTVLPRAPSSIRREFQGALRKARQADEALVAAVEKQVDAAVADMKAALIQADALAARGFPAFEIERQARSFKADLVVVGSHGHAGPRKILLGSVAEAVKDAVPAHLLVARNSPRRGPILAPVDGSPASRQAVRLSLRLAQEWKTRALVYHVFDPPLFAYPGQGLAEFDDVIRGFRLPPKTRYAQYVLEAGKPASKIVAFARRRRTPLLVMGSRGLGGLRGRLLGSVSNRVLQEAPCAVLLVKPSR